MNKSTVSTSTSMTNTQTMWCFLIKAENSVIYDMENKGLSHFSSNENKGLKSIAEIRCSVIKPLTYYR